MKYVHKGKIRNKMNKKVNKNNFLPSIFKQPSLPSKKENIIIVKNPKLSKNIPISMRLKKRIENRAPNTDASNGVLDILFENLENQSKRTKIKRVKEKIPPSAKN